MRSIITIKKNNNYITIVAAKYKHVVPYGVLSLDESGNCEALTEKPENDYLINTGMYMVRHELIDAMPENEAVSFPEIIERCKAEGKKIGAYVIEESAYMDMGQMEEMDRMKNKLRV